MRVMRHNSSFSLLPMEEISQNRGYEEKRRMTGHTTVAQ